MNKLVLSVSLVAVMLGATGYYLFSSGFSELRLAQYLPDSLSSYFQNEPSEVIEIEPEINSEFQDDTITEVIEETMEAPEEIVEVVETQEDTVSQVQDINSDIKFEPTTESNIEETPVVNMEVNNSNSQSVSNQAEAPEANKPEVLVKLESELDEKNTSMNKLDSENEKLQQKFMDMLKQNKNLALQLSQLEDKIKSKN